MTTERYVRAGVAPKEVEVVTSLRDRFEAAVQERVEFYAAAGLREITPNKGPVIDRMQRFVGLLEPSPWCTAAAVLIQHEAAAAVGAISFCPKLQSGAKLARYGLKHADDGICTIITAARHLRPGDIVVMGSNSKKTARIKRGSLASGHTVTVREMTSDVGFFLTGEGNTNAAGHREGQSFLLKGRAWSSPLRAMGLRFHVQALP